MGSQHLASVISGLWLSWGHRVRHLVCDRESPLLAMEPPPGEIGLRDLLHAAAAADRYSVTALAEELGTQPAALLHVAEDIPTTGAGTRDLAVLDRAFAAARDVLESFPVGTVISSCQGELGTLRRWRDAVGPSGAPWICWPETYEVGRWLRTALEADSIRIGAESDGDLDALRALVPPSIALDRIGTLLDAELYKHATNALLTTLIGFGNELQQVARSAGADELAVAQAVLADDRFTNRMPIRGGLPITAPTLLREATSFATLIAATGRPSLLGALLDANERLLQDLLAWTIAQVPQSARILVAGVGYKPEAIQPHTSFGTRLLDGLAGRSGATYAHHPGFDEHAAQAWPWVRWTRESAGVRADDLDLVVEVLPQLVPATAAGVARLRPDCGDLIDAAANVGAETD